MALTERRCVAETLPLEHVGGPDGVVDDGEVPEATE